MMNETDTTIHIGVCAFVIAAVALSVVLTQAPKSHQAVPRAPQGDATPLLSRSNLVAQCARYEIEDQSRMLVLHDPEWPRDEQAERVLLLDNGVELSLHLSHASQYLKEHGDLSNVFMLNTLRGGSIEMVTIAADGKELKRETFSGIGLKVVYSRKP